MSTTAPDINDLALLNEPVQGLDPNAQAEDFFKQSLMDDGDHQAVLTLGQDNVSHDRQRDKSTGEKTGDVYIKAHLMAKIDDPGDASNGMVAFDRVTSIVFGSKGTSALHAVMAMAGAAIPPALTKGEIIEFVKRELSTPRRITITTEWEAQVEDQSKAKGSRDRYKVVLTGQKRFPKLLGPDGQETGKHDPEGVVDPVLGKASTQVRIIRYAPAR